MSDGIYIGNKLPNGVEGIVIHLDDTEDIASRIDEVIEQNLGFLSQGGVGEAIDATGTAAEKAAAALEAFSRRPNATKHEPDDRRRSQPDASRDG